MQQLQFDNPSYIKTTLEEINHLVLSHFEQTGDDQLSILQITSLCFKHHIFPREPQYRLTKDVWNNGRPLMILINNGNKLKVLDSMMPCLKYDIINGRNANYLFKNPNSIEEYEIQPSSSSSSIKYDKEDIDGVIDDLKEVLLDFWDDRSEDSWIKIQSEIKELNVFVSGLKHMSKKDIQVTDIKQSAIQILRVNRSDAELKDYQIENRKIYERSFEYWSTKEDDLLKKADDICESIIDITEIFHRSPKAIEMRIKSLNEGRPI
jgi:hypothetical protein